MPKLQRQVATLERHLHQLSSRPNAASEPETKRRPSNPDQLKTQLVTLSRAKARLRAENTQLRRQFREASQYGAMLSDLLKTEHKLYCAHSSYFRLLTPLSYRACYEINSRTLQMIHAFDSKKDQASTIGTVAGWCGRRFVDGRLFKFALDKIYRRISMHVLLARLWSHLVDPMCLEKIYSAEMKMRARLVQKVDEDNYVFLEEMQSTDPGDNGALVKTAVLISRFKTDTGYRIHIQNLAREQIEMEDRATGETVALQRELWISNEQLVWAELDEVDSEAVSVKFRGVVPTIGASAYFWMSEIVLVCLRTELEIIGPRFSIPAS